MTIENLAHIDAATFETLARTLASQTSIKNALDWFSAQAPPLAIADMITQDEFSHDIVVAYPGGLYLVYDVS